MLFIAYLVVIGIALIYAIANLIIIFKEDKRFGNLEGKKNRKEKEQYKKHYWKY